MELFKTINYEDEQIKIYIDEQADEVIYQYTDNNFTAYTVYNTAYYSTKTIALTLYYSYYEDCEADKIILGRSFKEFHIEKR